MSKTRSIPEALRKRMSNMGRKSWEVRKQRAEEAEQLAAESEPEPQATIIEGLSCPQCGAAVAVFMTGESGTARIGDVATCSKLCGRHGNVIEGLQGGAEIAWAEI